VTLAPLPIEQSERLALQLLTPDMHDPEGEKGRFWLPARILGVEFVLWSPDTKIGRRPRP
jgi:hypothetical protein